MRSFLMIAGLAGLLASSMPVFAASGPGHANPSGADRNPALLAENHRPNGWDRANDWDRSSGWNHRNSQPWSQSRDHGGLNHDRRWQNPDLHRHDGAFNHGPRERLSKQVIHARLRDQRFHNLSDWHFRNGFYRLSAEDRYGHDVKLIVNAHDGRVVKVYRD